MPYEIINTLKAKSTIRIVGNGGNTHINLSSLAASSSETVSAASIAQVSACTNGIFRIYRGNSSAGVLIMEIPTFGHFVLYEYDISFANSSTSNVFVEHTGTAGTLVLQLAKTATYSTDLGKL